MAALTIIDAVIAGVNAPTLGAAASGGDTVALGPDVVLLHVKNTNGATRRVVVDSLINCNQGSDHNIDVTVPATTGDMWIAINPTNRFKNSSGVGDISYPDGVSGVTIAAMKIA